MGNDVAVVAGFPTRNANSIRTLLTHLAAPNKLASFGRFCCLIVRKKVMPLYEYELCEGDCKVCGGKFTLRRPLDAQELTKCPACKKPVRKLFSTFNSPKALSFSDAKKAGFKVYKKLGKGEYERQ
jgi:putative FmdB family regulatory protein